MNPRIKITCSILCYNYGRYLGPAIESCLTQDSGNFDSEVLVIDDGSTDETPQVCRHYADRVRTLRSANEGFGSSLGKAVREARGDFVCLLDADDLFEPSKLRILAEEFARGRRFVSHNMSIIDANGTLTGERGVGGNTSTIGFARTEALDLLPTSNELAFHLLADAGLGCHLATPLARYRIHAKSMTDRTATSAHTDYFARVNHEQADRCARLAKEPPAWTDRRTLLRNARRYRQIGCAKDMERALELRRVCDAARSALRVLGCWFRMPRVLPPWQSKLIVKTALACVGWQVHKR